MANFWDHPALNQLNVQSLALPTACSAHGRRFFDTFIKERSVYYVSRWLQFHSSNLSFLVVFLRESEGWAQTVFSPVVLFVCLILEVFPQAFSAFHISLF